MALAVTTPKFGAHDSKENAVRAFQFTQEIGGPSE
jgi:hypothetical protein